MESAPSAHSVRFDNVSFAYGQGTAALRDVSLEIPPGQFVAVTGANGSGKTTFAKHINGLLVPSDGAVYTAGYDTRDVASMRAVRTAAGMVFQNPDNQAVASVVADDVAFGPENLGLERAEIERRVQQALEQVGMWEHARADIDSLSGGQKQLVAIAGVLAMEPRILVLDEPGAMLDARGRKRVMEAAHALHGQGMTIVLITHFMEEAQQAQRVIVLDGGSVVLDGAPGEVLVDGARLRGLGLEPPFAVKLAEALGGRGLAVPATLDEGELAECLAAQGHARRAVQGSQSACTSPLEPASHGAARPAALSFENVSFSYDGVSQALDAVSFEVPEGQTVGLVGHTGSGKSTAVQLMNALLVPTGGRVVSCGIDTADKRRARDVRSRVGVAFQYPEQQLFAATVGEDVAFGPRNLGLPEAEVHRRCADAMSKVGLDLGEFAQRSPFGLSGGQQRRVALAGILAMEPQVLVLDEPAAGMDPATNAQIKRYLRELNAAGTTIVVVSHSMDDVAELCDTVICLEVGRVAMAGTPADVFARAGRQRLVAMGLELPRAAAFAQHLREQGICIPEGVSTLEELASALA